GKARSNQVETAGWKADWGIEALSDGAVAGSATAWAGADPGLLSGSRPGARGVGWLLVHLLPRPLMTLRPSLLATALLAATGMASAADASVPTGPLPRTVVPSEVALQLTIDPAQARFSGHVDISVDVARATDTIWMHGKGLSIAKAVYKPANGKEQVLTAAEVDVSGVLKLTAPKAIAAGK